jgi:hypothetical protein
MSLFHKLFGSDQGLFTTESYDPEKEYPAIRASICTGEKVAGFRSKLDGRFTEVMLIRSKKDEEEFKQRYQVDELKVEY